MSTATANKPPAGTGTGTTNTAPSGTPRRDAASARTAASASASASPAASTRSPARSGAATPTRTARSTPTAPASRTAIKKPAPPSTLRRNSSQVDTASADAAAAAAARDEQAALLADLTERLRVAETEAEERARQVEVLNARLDEAVSEQAKLEERAHEEEEKAEALENAKREVIRQHRELEAIYEAERAQAMRDKEVTIAREEEMQETIQRLKESREKETKAKGKDGDDDEPLVSRASSFRNSNLDAAASFAPPNSVTRSNSRSNSKLIHQKDKIIEDLRLELAEYQVKLLEVENAGGGRMHELEKQLLETRMTNARLMEDNESFQLLLGEKTLNGDLARGDFLRESSHADDRAPSRQGPSTSLADELESAEEADVEVVRRLEAEVNSMKDQNKALTLYINKIIGRLLTYQGFESVLGNDAEGENAAPNTNKDLPPPPPKDTATDAPQGFLSRAKSVMGTNPRKQRPMSIAGPSPSMNEDPATAPRIPLSRTQSTRAPSGSNPHRRSTSTIPDTNAANIVNTMYRMPPPAATPGQTSPGLVSPRNSFFGIPIATPSNASTASTPTSRAVSGTGQIPEDREPDARSDAASTTGGHVDTPSPPRGRERADRGDAPPMTMSGKGMRPLRLVQNEEEAVKARKAANRASWFGGLFGQAAPSQQTE